MRKNQAYYDSPAIGSSLLSTFIEDSPDHALMEVKPNEAMEMGRIWEDLVEYYLSDSRNRFTNKYFVSEQTVFPKPTKLPSIPELMDRENVEKAIMQAYIWNKGKPTKKGEKAVKKLNSIYKTYHDLLDEIKANNYKRPIPKDCWDTMKKMWDNFCKAQWMGNNIVQMLKGLKDVKFQTEHYWTDLDSGAKCRMKSDIEAVYETAEGKQGWLADLKLTSGIVQFEQRTKKYRWQDRHYTTGYGQKCRNNDILPPLSMPFIISEMKAPYLTYVRTIRPLDAMELQTEYDQNLTDCWQWIKGGKQAVGYKEQYVNKYGRIVN